MSVKGQLVAAFAKDHSYYETLDFVCKLIGLDDESIKADKLLPEEQKKEEMTDAENPVQYWLSLPEEERLKFKSVHELNDCFKKLKTKHANDEDQWITTEEGHHVKLGKGGEFEAGFGGKHNGETLKEAFGKKKDTDTNKQGSGYTKPDSPERKKSLENMIEYGKSMRKFHVPLFMSDRLKAINSLPDDIGYFSEMARDDPEGYMKYIEEKYPPESDILNNADEYKWNKYVDPKKVLDADDHFAMLSIVMNEFMHTTDDDLIKCIEDKDFCREKFLEAVQRDQEKAKEEIVKEEEEYDKMQTDRSSYKDRIEAIREEDKENAERFGEKTTASETYYEYIESCQEDLSLEDFVVQRAYISGGLGLNAERLNQRLYAKEPLDEGEKEFVERLRKTAKSFKADMLLYRMMSEETLKSMFDGNDVQVGMETTQDAFASSSCGGMAQWWAGCSVAVRYHMKEGQKAIGLFNYPEGEILLLNKSKIKVTGMENTSEDLPIWGLTGNIYSGNDVGREPKERLVVDVEVIYDGSDL